MTSYAQFLARKQHRVQHCGPACEPEQVSAHLHDWQRELTAWAVRSGRAALWWSTGLGKTRAQLEWARLSGKRSLVVAPLAVCRQTVAEAAAIDVEAAYVRSGSAALGAGIWVTNYEMVDRFDPAEFDAVVLDESGILKGHDRKTRNKLIRQFADVSHRLSATATPAPNDPQELTNHAEFLGVMTRPEMLATYFVHDDEGWRLKRHAVRPMFAWMASWACALRTPADLGYPDEAYRLPELHIRTHLVSSSRASAADLGGVLGRSAVRKATLEDRIDKVAEIVRRESGQPWLLWCGLNAEQDALAEEFSGRAISIYGSLAPEEKVDRLYSWINGERPILISKPRILGFGMNFQHCARMAFVGLSDSFESYYQSIRRCWRYGQRREVDAHIVLSEAEKAIADNVMRKETQMSWLIEQMVVTMNAERTQEMIGR